MAKNFALQEAARARQDEFYTSRSDIENEMKYYKPHFKGKTVLCNCDDPYESEFFKYFALFFNVLGLKKLIATCYECIELLKEADIVTTNPPHSLLREYIALLTQYSKKFIILGNINAVTYKEVFPLIMQNKLWMGVTIHSDSCDELQERRLYPYMRLLIRKIADFI